jgi:methylated-DNA-[protein]-cysteine S-methyltransferase
MAWFDVLETPLGEVFIGGSSRGVHRIEFVRAARNGHPGNFDRAHWVGRLEADAGEASERDAEAAGEAREVRTQLREYIEGMRSEFTFALAPVGSEWQRAVWRELLSIPFGATTTYGAIARALGRPSAARAVGASVGRNPIAIVIPCHRVLGANGALTGYAAGIERKRWLLDLEERVAWPLAARQESLALAV